MGCCAAAALVARWPQIVDRLVLYWPVGGAKYRLQGHARFNEHAVYVQQHGLAGVVALARESDKSFGGDPRGGPWVSVLRRDPAFAEAYAALDPDAYRLLLAVTARTLFDRDTAPGAEPEDLMRLDLPALIVPGRDHAHAVSAARISKSASSARSTGTSPSTSRPKPTSPIDYSRSSAAGSSIQRQLLVCLEWRRGCCGCPLHHRATEAHRDAQSLSCDFSIGRAPRCARCVGERTRAYESPLNRPRLHARVLAPPAGLRPAPDRLRGTCNI